MIKVLLKLCLLLPLIAVAQDSIQYHFKLDTTGFNHQFGWKLDSTEWMPHDTIFVGQSWWEVCAHEWVYGDEAESRTSSVIFGYDKSTYWQADPIGKFNFYQHRHKICRLCLREVSEHLEQYWHYEAPPMTEYEILKEQQRPFVKLAKKKYRNKH